MSERIEITDRQALICELALDMAECGRWPELQRRFKEFCGETLTEQKLATLQAALRGES